MKGILYKGDTLVANCGAYDHYGISDGNGLVYENSKTKGGPRVTTLDEFSAGRKIKNIGKLGKLSPNAIVSRAKWSINNKKKYKLLTNNCEHFIREVCNVDIKSPQVRAKLFSAVFLTLAYNSDNNIVKSIAAFAGMATLFTKDEKNIVRNTVILTIAGVIAGVAYEYSQQKTA